MPRCEVGDVVRVPFPYSDGTPRYRRPALVVSVIRPEDAPFLIWVLMITSTRNRSWAGDLSISDLAAAGLPAASVVRTAKIATIEAARAERIGKLPSGVMADVRATLDRRLSIVNRSSE